MLIIIFTIIIAAIIILIIAVRPRRNTKVYFIGPRSSGKTSAIIKLMGSECKTVPTISTHSIVLGNRTIIELPENRNSQNFQIRYGIVPGEKYIFFMREEDEEVPKQPGMKIQFVKWRGQANETKGDDDVVYLEESVDRLKQLLK